jgi:cbb3-type cytochrome c oxidase subunit III
MKSQQERRTPSVNGSARLAALGFAAALLAACGQGGTAGSAPTKSADAAQSAALPEEYGEFYASPDELVAPPVNEIARSMRLNATAKTLGLEVYNKNCASCHGADMKGSAEQHAPDLTDEFWRFSGDDLESGGATLFASDVEWTVRYGVRSGHRNQHGSEADMVAFDPQYRNKVDTEEYGAGRFLTEDQIADVAEYVLKISGQDADATKAARGDVLFHDGDTGNCFDCHGDDALGDLSLGSTNLTRKSLYLYGTDRQSITESINRGRHGVMPAFEGKLKPEEIKAVSVYVFSRAGGRQIQR